MKRITCLIALLFIGFFCINSLSGPADNEVPYPDGYREWRHMKGEIIGPKSAAFPRFGGIHHIYANDKAMEGYAKGKFPDGSIFVLDVLEMIEASNGNLVEGQRRFIDVMAKDSHRYDSTGGWGFEEFDGNSITKRNILGLAGKQCFTCHAKQQKKDFVFSEFRK